ncbi:hypothetical protein Psed_3219 [Pseudonocardia dioxanivorans CB1190]|uniref:Uncharacterized protein n=1 Tax=Pseudonocardia dioxanivorans (strain ATCC 55486 / DSM 44775 / JCM 13855 / CB1190) TaxID=675635 RepID=F4CVS8_PSEUX|nr:hypothetical protein Psed_3219 [Pseudonocardia dioxanivorans CB1190]
MSILDPIRGNALPPARTAVRKRGLPPIRGSIRSATPLVETAVTGLYARTLCQSGAPHSRRAAGEDGRVEQDRAAEPAAALRRCAGSADSAHALERRSPGSRALHAHPSGLLSGIPWPGPAPGALIPRSRGCRRRAGRSRRVPRRPTGRGSRGASPGDRSRGGIPSPRARPAGRGRNEAASPHAKRRNATARPTPTAPRPRPDAPPARGVGPECSRAELLPRRRLDREEPRSRPGRSCGRSAERRRCRAAGAGATPECNLTVVNRPTRSTAVAPHIRSAT